MIISVDDGYVDDVRTILPALERFHMVATFFVITGRMNEPGFLTPTRSASSTKPGWTSATTPPTTSTCGS